MVHTISNVAATNATISMLKKQLDALIINTPLFASPNSAISICPSPVGGTSDSTFVPSPVSGTSLSVTMSTSTVEVRITVDTGILSVVVGVSGFSGREVGVSTTLAVVLGIIDMTLCEVLGTSGTVGMVVKMSLEDMCGGSVVSKLSDITAGMVGIRGTLVLDSVVVGLSDTMRGVIGESGTVSVVVLGGRGGSGVFVVVWISAVVCAVVGSPEVVGIGSASITVIRHPRLRCDAHYSVYK